MGKQMKSVNARKISIIHLPFYENAQQFTLTSRWGGRGQCLEAEKTQSQKNA
jgi:hypothetical protein